MGDILIDNQTIPSTPAAGKVDIFTDSTTKRLGAVDDAGVIFGSPLSGTSAVASQGAGFASDTYITTSGILIPSYGLKAGMLFQWWISFSKTAAGTATPIMIVRVGSAQTTADTARNTMTGQAATAAVSGGIMQVQCQVRTVSATGVLVGAFGFASGVLGPGGGIDNVSSTWDNTAVAGQYVGLSLNAGASASWTLTSVTGTLIRP